MRYIINESELVFDAADFVRCGRDLFVTRSNVTNATGIDWLRRHLGDGFRIHEVETMCRQPMRRRLASARRHGVRWNTSGKTISLEAFPLK